MFRRLLCLFVVLAASACATSTTEILVVVDSDLVVPGDLDEVLVTVTHPDGMQTMTSMAALGPGSLSLPRTLGVVHRGGPLGPYRMVVQGRLRGVVQVERAGELSFVSQEIRIWRVSLDRACQGIDCAMMTCAAGSCRAVVVEAGELTPYSDAFDAGGGRDAGIVDSGAADGGAPFDGGPGCNPDCSGRACTCDMGCTCSMTCPAVGCNVTCVDADTMCTVDAAARGGAAGRCETGATCTVLATETTDFVYECRGDGTNCDVDCGGSDSCELQCQMGAVCMLRCLGASNCRIRMCSGGATSCPNDVFVCGRDCP